MNFLDKRKKELGIFEAGNLNDNVPTGEQIDKLSKDVDKELNDVTDGEPKEPKEDFITSEEASKRIRGGKQHHLYECKSFYGL